MMKNTADSDKGVVIPFVDGFVYPIKKISANFRGFCMLTAVMALGNALIALLCGRGFFCGRAMEMSGFYCSIGLANLLVSVIALLFGIAMYANRWFQISESGEKIDFKVKRSDIVMLGFVVTYFALWGGIGIGAYVLNVRKASANFYEEVIFFLLVSLCMLAAGWLLLNYVLLILKLQGKKWLLLGQTFWPLFDNIHKIFVWFLFFFLILAYLLRNVLSFFGTDKFLFSALSNLAGEFCFYFIIYLTVAVFVSSMAYQAQYIFNNKG